MKVPVLDHGSIEVIESWGSDERIIEAARMSTAKGFLGWGTSEKPGDEKLLRFLWENKHHTPFEMAGATIEVQAPIFVFREWHRHRTQSYNELSARYTPLPDVNYLPTLARCKTVSTTNKQAGAVAEQDSEKMYSWIRDLEGLYNILESFYQRGLAAGVPKEVARVIVPVGRYSRMRASANLRNWLAFLTLRAAPAAQYEIREYAQVLQGLLGDYFPRTMELFNGAGHSA